MDNVIALAGNPNSGKTTLFNELTGSHQHVGNYPGVTVEKKQGIVEIDGTKINLIDLPGTYSLTAYSLEEVVARDVLVLEQPAAVINIVDASNLERNLYLSLQFLEMGIPLCIALNMFDVATKRGININADELSKVLGVPVIPTVARTGHGKVELLKAAARFLKERKPIKPIEIFYGEDIDNALLKMADKVQAAGFMTEYYSARWIALKYLENDEKIQLKGKRTDPVLAAELEGVVDQVSDHLEKTLGTYPEALIADHRYGYIRSIIHKGIISVNKGQHRPHVSDKIDLVLTHRLAGPIVMLLVIILLYHFVFTYSERPVGWLESFFGWISAGLGVFLPEGLLKSLVISGVIDGVGGVLGFVPLIMFMFFGIAILEDSGYLARVAFMLDRVFRVFGLHGNSVMAYIVSGGIAGGCAVPGVMATRTLRSPRERLATLLTVPFMNCGAKLPVFAMLVAAFFAENEAMMMLYITLLAWGGALLIAKVLRLTVIKGESTPFVMELPPYRLPTLKGLFIHTWARTWQYIRKAGTIVLGVSVLLWAMMTFPGLPQTRKAAFEQDRQRFLNSVYDYNNKDLKNKDDNALSTETKRIKIRLTEIDARLAEERLRYSIAGRFGTALESVSRWAGFDWRTNIALVGGFAAKEVVVSTLGTAYSLGEVDPQNSVSLSQRLSQNLNWRPLVALSLIVFIVFYTPCFVAVVCIAREAGSWKWGAFSMIFNTVVAFVMAVLIYQIGSAMGY